MFGSDSSTTTRPSPSLPRRKPTLRRVCVPSFAAGSANRDVLSDWATASALVGIARLMYRSRPDSRVLKVDSLLRLSTSLVRSPTSTMLKLRRCASFKFWDERPSAFPVAGKSKAMRAGEATLKLAGTVASSDLVVTLTSTSPPCCDTRMDSMLFGCACATASAGIEATASAHSRPASLRTKFIFLPPAPATGAYWYVRPIRRPRPERFPSR